MIIISDKLLFRKVFEFSQFCAKCLLALLFCQSVQAFQDHDSLDSEELLVKYLETNNLTRTLNQDIAISIYRTGDVFILIPEYMKQAGHYHVFLEQEKLDTLWLLLISEKILKFDSQALQDMLIRERQLLKESHAVVTSVSDKAEILLEIFPNRYQPPGLIGKEDNAVKRITWSGLRWDAEHYPQIESIQLLSQIQKFMFSILQRDDLQPID